MRARENRTQRLIAWIAVALVHLLVFWWLAFSQTQPRPEFPPVIDLWLGPTGASVKVFSTRGGV